MSGTNSSTPEKTVTKDPAISFLDKAEKEIGDSLSKGMTVEEAVINVMGNRELSKEIPKTVASAIRFLNEAREENSRRSSDQPR